MHFSSILCTLKKIVDFRFPARLINAVTCTEILCFRTTFFNYGRAPGPRALPPLTLYVFHYFHQCFIHIFLGTWIQFAWTWKKHTDLPSFFRSRLPVEPICSIDAYDENLKFWKPAKSEFWGVQNWTWRTDPRPLPCLCRHEQGRGLQFSEHVCSGPERFFAFRNMFARGPNHVWPRCVHFASQNWFCE